MFTRVSFPFLLAALLCSLSVTLYPAAQNSQSLTRTLTFPKVFNRVEGGYSQVQPEEDLSIALDLNQACPISKLPFFEHFEIFPILIVAAVETEDGRIRFYNGFSISSWLLNGTLSAPKRTNQRDPLTQTPITCISYFLLTSSAEEDCQFLCTLDDLTENTDDARHQYCKLLLRATGSDSVAQNKLANLYRDHGQTLGYESLEDRIRLTKGCYQAAADQGHTLAQYKLGELYAVYWQILDHDRKASFRLARDYFQAAADKGFPSAHNALGVLYETDWESFEITQKEGLLQARDHFQVAADLGYGVAHRHLAGLYYEHWRDLEVPSYEEAIRREAYHLENCDDSYWELKDLYLRHPFILGTFSSTATRCNIL